MLALFLFCLSSSSRAFACVVGPNCTESALDTCLPGGAGFDGIVAFDCSGMIVVTNTKVISADTAIDGGSQVTISGGNAVGVFTVNAGVKATIQSLTIANCNNTTGHGGAILNAGTLSVVRSTFSGNSAHYSGGAISNAGTLTITSSTFSDNHSAHGGAIGNAGTLSVVRSTFFGNSAVGANGSGASGGAISNGISATATITDSSVSNNSAAFGAGMFSDGPLTVFNSTVSNNTGSFGGGIDCDHGALTLANSTVSGNSATYEGGGAYITGPTSAITNSTFSGNSQGRPGGGSSIVQGEYALITVTNTILSSSISNANCKSYSYFGGITDGGHNIDSGTSCGFSTASGSFNNANPRLDPAGLQSNGGLTQTIALCTGAGSPGAGCTGASSAINAGDQGVCSASPVNSLDQRGFVRPGAGATKCSIGAFEANSSPAPCIASVDNDSDGVSEESASASCKTCQTGMRTSCLDNCLGTYNPDQADSDGDGIGDACDTETTPSDCADGLDNDGNGAIDQNDPGCSPDLPATSFTLTDEDDNVVATATYSDLVAKTATVALAANTIQRKLKGTASTPGGQWLLNGAKLTTNQTWSQFFPLGEYRIEYQLAGPDGHLFSAGVKFSIVTASASCPSGDPIFTIGTPQFVAPHSSVQIPVIGAFTNSPGQPVLYAYSRWTGAGWSALGSWATQVVVPRTAVAVRISARYQCSPKKAVYPYQTFILPSWANLPPPTQNQSPLIFVPGVYGTELDAGTTRLWPVCGGAEAQLSFADQLKLDENGHGVVPVTATRVLDTACWPPQEIYLGFRQFVTKYWPANSFDEVPYDWRLDVGESDSAKVFTDLDCKVFCEGCPPDKPSYCKNGPPPKVDLVGHSLGGLVLKQYLISRAAAGKPLADHIGHVIMVGTPHLGAPQAAYVLLTGDAGLDHAWGLLGITQDYIKRFADNAAGGYALLPSPKYPHIFFDIRNAEPPLKDYIGYYSGSGGAYRPDAERFWQVFTGPAFPFGVRRGPCKEYFHDDCLKWYYFDEISRLNSRYNEWALSRHNAWDNWNPPAGIPLHLIYVSNRDTALWTEIRSASPPAEFADAHDAKECESTPALSGECSNALSHYDVKTRTLPNFGDGKVPTDSAKGPWPTPAPDNVHRWDLHPDYAHDAADDYEHGSLMLRYDVRETIYKILAQGCLPESTTDECAVQAMASQLASPGSTAAASLHSERPARALRRWTVSGRGVDGILATDDLGNSTGLAAGAAVHEILGSSYTRTGAERYELSAPISPHLNLTTVGGDGHSELLVTKQWRRLISAAVYADLPATEASCVGGAVPGTACVVDLQCGDGGHCDPGTTCQLALSRTSSGLPAMTCGNIEVAPENIDIDFRDFRGTSIDGLLHATGSYHCTHGACAIHPAGMRFEVTNDEGLWGYDSVTVAEYSYLGPGEARIAGRCRADRLIEGQSNRRDCWYEATVSSTVDFTVYRRGESRELVLSEAGVLPDPESPAVVVAP